MKTLFVSQTEARDLLPMDQCIDAVRSALAAQSRGEAIQPLRPVMWLPERVGALGMMPGHLGSIDTMGIKTVTVFPGNEGTPHDSHQGTVMLFDAHNGALKAVIDATEITAIRTAAASAVATDLLARKDASVLAILGAGVQGGTHAAAIPLVRGIEDVRVWSRTESSAQSLASRVAGSARPVATIEEAVSGADIICTTTSAVEPILSGSIIDAGSHVNAVGSSVPFARELDGLAIAKASLFVDRVESTLNESGDFLMARDEGSVTDEDLLAEIGDVILGNHPGRTDDLEVTAFISLGLAIEDIAAADVIYRNALASGVGRLEEFGGMRHA